MGFKKIVARGDFWKSVALLGISFLLIYNLISMLFEYGGFEIARFFEERTEDGKLFRFILGQLIAAFIYGFIFSYGQFRMKEKKEASEEEK